MSESAPGGVLYCFAKSEVEIPGLELRLTPLLALFPAVVNKSLHSNVIHEASRYCGVRRAHYAHIVVFSIMYTQRSRQMWSA